jgi:hypothetical protein
LRRLPVGLSHRGRGHHLWASYRTGARGRARGGTDLGGEISELQLQLSFQSRYDLKVRGRVALWRADCAARVAALFERERPHDATVRDTIAAARAHGLALCERGVEFHQAIVHAREPDKVSRLRLEAARECSEAWRNTSASLVQTLPEGAARSAVIAAWTGPESAKDAAQAVYLAQSDPEAAQAAREAEEHWQLQRLIDRMLPGDLEDWPLPPSKARACSVPSESEHALDSLI